MRHGLKEDNFSQKVVDGLRTNFTIELHPEAYEGLDAVRTFFEARHQHFGLVLSSPFLRTLETAKRFAQPNTVIGLEPGLSEALVGHLGLAGQPTQSNGLEEQLRALVEKIDPSVQPSIHVPLMATTELRPEQDHGCARAAEVAARLRARHELFARGAVLCVTHGSLAFGLIEALQDGSRVPVFQKRRMPEMGSVTELVEDADGAWSVVGNACPSRQSSGAWQCHWSTGAAIGADATQL